MNNKLKVYFAGSIRGGRDKVKDYQKIVKFIEKDAIVLDKHVADPNLKQTGENKDLKEIYERDASWVRECDIVISEVTNPSLGVGYELGYAEAIGKTVICLCEEDTNLSPMIGGNTNFNIIKYKEIEDLEKIIHELLENNK